MSADAEDITRGSKRRVVFLTPEQAKEYGGYVDAVRALSADIVLPPVMLDDYQQDLRHLPFTSEVGHA